jgi:hypothetical protein
MAFENRLKNQYSQKNFEDYLGRGFSGDVMGKELEFLNLESRFWIYKTYCCLPDSTSLRHVMIVSDRLGSVGGEILKGFLLFSITQRVCFKEKQEFF